MPSVAMRVIVASLLFMPLGPVPGSATWSIIVLDRATGVIGVGGASCTADVSGIMALIPGTGALMAQAMGHPPAVREALRLLRAGVAPDSVLRVITAAALDTAIQVRQYGMATFRQGQVQYTGTGVADYHGERSADGVLVQGNILTGAAVLDRAMAAIQAARAAAKPMEEIVLAGLKAGADAGGDSRCGAQRATSAFLAVARPGDLPSWPFLTLRVLDVARGSSIQAVDLLQARLAHWQAGGGAMFRITSESVKPDSAGGE
jgi:uncharacterized Ntn-hydrolase superfamily protein